MEFRDRDKSSRLPIGLLHEPRSDCQGGSICRCRVWMAPHLLSIWWPMVLLHLPFADDRPAHGRVRKTRRCRWVTGHFAQAAECSGRTRGRSSVGSGIAAADVDSDQCADAVDRITPPEERAWQCLTARTSQSR